MVTAPGTIGRISSHLALAPKGTPSPDCSRGLREASARVSRTASARYPNATRVSARGRARSTSRSTGAPTFFGLNGRLALSVVTVNFLRAVDEVLHGTAGAKGWGLNARPDPTLLYVTGFNPVTQQYAYQVNDRFGATAGSATAFRPPFQIGFQARFTLGPDRRRAALDAMRGRGGGGIGGGRPGAGPGAGGFGLRGGDQGNLLARLDSLLPNPAALVLAHRDTLDLTPEQANQIEAVREAFDDRQAERGERLMRLIAEQGDTPNAAQLMPLVQPILQEARADIAAVHAEVRGILTDAQWERLPDDVRNLPRLQRRPGPQNQNR